eukprot:CAMPEP_0119324686 /NCGR_PEP_ID=MMETSP1333-20130426/63931_1 /TAXON_ID=418940 /ORGANISM="Scyphosphaera apsteinii, Strain RCC1455" /LENGTH=72 /DNA_ID=CAMNT_0007332463 /DNA_START=97 /DNA_END=315 /DNA_ORIENTATION=+
MPSHTVFAATWLLSPILNCYNHRVLSHKALAAQLIFLDIPDPQRKRKPLASTSENLVLDLSTEEQHSPARRR